MHRGLAQLHDRAVLDSSAAGNGTKALVSHARRQPIERDLSLRPHGGQRHHHLTARPTEDQQQVGAQLGEHLVFAGLASEDRRELTRRRSLRAPVEARHARSCELDPPGSAAGLDEA